MSGKFSLYLTLTISPCPCSLEDPCSSFQILSLVQISLGSCNVQSRCEKMNMVGHTCSMSKTIHY